MELSGFNPPMAVSRQPLKAWKDIRIATLTLIQEAIDNGNEPGACRM